MKVPATYIYAIIPTGDQVVFEVAGLDDHDDEVYSIPHDQIAAVVGVSPLADYRGLQRHEAVRYLVAHQRVLETIMRDYPALPVKFGTVLPDEDRVRHLLAQAEPLFRAALERLAGQVQMEVVILWNLQEVFQQIGQEEPIARLKAHIASRPPEETMAERVALGQMVKASLEGRRAALSDRLLPPLRQVALDMVLNPLMDDSMVTNVALLLNKAGRGALDQRLEQLDEAFERRLHLRCVGPLPPYSFATVEVQVPSFAAVDEARRRLGLGETATEDEIKRAYHQMAFRLHPDYNPSNAGSESPMAELTQAHRLLTAYAENVQGGRGAEGQQSAIGNRQSAIPFSREAVERTLLIAIRQQEVLPPGSGAA